MQSITANEIFQKVDARQLGMMVRFYRASEVDAERASMLASARALVEAVVEDHPYLENSPQGEKCPICQAIAAVERHLLKE